MRVARYWREVFGLADSDFTTAGIRVQANSGRVAGRSAAWIFLHEDCCLISAPSDLVESARAATVGLAQELLLTSNVADLLFPGRAAHVIGPSYQGYAERSDFCPLPCDRVRPLSERDRPALERFVVECGSSEWDASGLSVDHEPLFAYFDRGAVLAIAGPIPWASYAANVGMVTHPGCRGRGCGTAVASAAMDHILGQGNVVLYQTLLENRPAIRIAATLGCREFARMMYVELESG